MRSIKRKHHSFTLVELLIAIAIFSLVIVLISSLLSGINKTWVSGEQRVESYQNGRAILNLMARDLKSAVVSSTLQFIENPPLGSVEQLPWNQRRNSSAIFWQSALQSGAAGNICEVGYYIDKNYRLQRFFVPPDNANYNIFATAPSALGAAWVTNFDPVTQPALFSVVSDGVLGMWVRCMDRNGEAIPWYQSSGILYNSAASFQPAPPGASPSPGFKYTNAANTARAHLLPYSVEITIVMLDKKALARPGLVIPGLPQDPSDPSSPSANSPNDIPAAIHYFEQKLISNKIDSARTFLARVQLANSSQ
ncbi:MAG: hypothetical protein QOI04_1464 [Verrucomicrobiota bacterium]|jgi:type II secretory pathway component PulJ